MTYNCTLFIYNKFNTWMWTINDPYIYSIMGHLVIHLYLSLQVFIYCLSSCSDFTSSYSDFTLSFSQLSNFFFFLPPIILRTCSPFYLNSILSFTDRLYYNLATIPSLCISSRGLDKMNDISLLVKWLLQDEWELRRFFNFSLISSFKNLIIFSKILVLH